MRIVDECGEFLFLQIINDFQKAEFLELRLMNRFYVI